MISGYFVAGSYDRTGFGLFFIRKMMDVYGWTITEKGESGKGAKFDIKIPGCAISGSEKDQFA